MTTTHLPPHPPPPQPPLAVLPPTRRRADRTPTSPMPYLIRSMGIPLGEGRGYRVPLPFVFQSFPDLLQRIDSVSPEVLAATREMHWRERARRIMDDALSWSQCTREWREAEEELDPDADAGAQEPDATVDDDSYYTGGAYYYVQAADDDQE
ncbi:uncharacterized protein [Aegilops tauschii subsp. strangulata]|uniref:uncharacterized protein isoform X1 n=1 Tax=Aegilops tauschii subsp. strangulata TaxID=200361 RepID=UPI00098BC763|nr:uncharacterized protein LOC109781667 [Aegilops tauschii subsp. strangulata]